MPAARVLHAGLQLLDRQILDRDGMMAGNVDDLELSELEGGDGLYVSAIFSGAGALAYRVGARRFGRWWQRIVGAMLPDRAVPAGRIDFAHVRDIGDHITVGKSADELASYAFERWTRDHVIRRIPGSDHEAE